MLFVITFGIVIIGSAFGQTPAITIQTDLPSYKLGDTIVITGHVNNLKNSTLVSIEIFNPSTLLRSVGQFIPNSDGTFSLTITPTLPSYSDSGTYTILVTYGSSLTNATTTFNYVGQSTTTPSTNTTTAVPSANFTTHSKIPYWVRSIFNLYGQGQVSDDDLISALKFLIQTGVIKVS